MEEIDEDKAVFGWMSRHEGKNMNDGNREKIKDRQITKILLSEMNFLN